MNIFSGLHRDVLRLVADHVIEVDSSPKSVTVKFPAELCFDTGCFIDGVTIDCTWEHLHESALLSADSSKAFKVTVHGKTPAGKPMVRVGKAVPSHILNVTRHWTTIALMLWSFKTDKTWDNFEYNKDQTEALDRGELFPTFYYRKVAE